VTTAFARSLVPEGLVLQLPQRRHDKQTETEFPQMNIKSLLIGSAAALVAVSGARAADAVVAEPEAVEYVRVCDAYGSGYFYIPGTETCLKIGGWVRYDISGSSNYTNSGVNVLTPGAAGPYISATGFGKQARGRLEFTTKNESDLGTVVGWIRLDQRQRASAAGVPFGSVASTNHQFMLGVGGLEMGFRDSQWNRFSGYGGVTDNGLNYGYQERHYISYTFSGEAFSAIVSLDHDNSANYVPDVMAGVSGKFGSIGASLSLGYDESEKDAALKATADIALGAAKLRIVGQYATGQNSYWYATKGVANVNANALGIIVGVSAPVGEKLSLGVDVGYDKATGGNSTLKATADVNYKMASGLSALLEVNYSKTQTFRAENSYFLRFQRSF
jgi:Porin subfamily